MGPEMSLNDLSSGTTSNATKNVQPPPPPPPEEDHQAPVSSVTQTAEELQLFVTQQLVARIKDLERDRAQLNVKLEKFNKKEEQWNQWRVEQEDINREVMADLHGLLGENEGIADADPSVSVADILKEKLAKVGKKLKEAEKDKQEVERVFKEQLNETKMDSKNEIEVKDARIRELKAEILELKIQKSTEEEEKKTLDQIRRILDKNEDRDKEEPQPAEPQPRQPQEQDKEVEDDDIKPVVEADKNTEMTVALLPVATGFKMNASARKETSGNEEPVEAQDVFQIGKQLQLVPILQPNVSRPTLAQERQLKLCPKIILHRCDYKEKNHESKKKVRFQSSLEASQTEADEVECKPKLKEEQVVITPVPGSGIEAVPFRKKRGRPSKLTSALLSNNEPKVQGEQSSPNVREKIFKCIWCPHRSNRFGNLRVHMMHMHASTNCWRLVGCSQCGKICRSRKAFFDHRRKNHDKVKRRTPKTVQ